MAKKYLTSSMRESVISIAALVGWLEDFVKDLSKTKTWGVQPLLSHLSCALTKASKGLDLIMKDLDTAELKKIHTMLATTNLTLVPSFRGEEMRKEQAELDKVEYITKEQAELLSEGIIRVWCQQDCRYKCGGHENCPVREVLMQWGIEPAKYEAEGCQYYEG